MRKFFACLIKEFFLLVRDKSGLILLFLMPLALVILVTLIQDNTFKAIKESSIRLGFLNEDNDSLGNSILIGLKKNKIFNIEEYSLSNKLSESLVNLKLKVAEGKNQIGIFIPKNTTNVLRNEISKIIKNNISRQKNSDSGLVESKCKIQIDVFLDPATKLSFKQTVFSTIQNYISSIENKLIYKLFMDELNKMIPFSIKLQDQEINLDFIQIIEHYPSLSQNEILPNSTQHNVPAWTLFAIFFIVIPLSGNMVRERDDGSGLRLKTMPVSYLTILSGKLSIYLAVCIIQFVMMFLAGMYLLPLFGLPALNLNVDIAALILLVVSAGLAASGYSILIGTIAGTQEQAAIFGSVSVMMFAAIGGIWVPTYIMPDFMRKLSVISPLNWGMEGFYDVFLRNGSINTIYQHIIMLVAFSAVMILLSMVYNKRKYNF